MHYMVSFPELQRSERDELHSVVERRARAERAAAPLAARALRLLRRAGARACRKTRARLQRCAHALGHSETVGPGR